MLQSIREHTQGWIAGIIISVIILSFALWGIHSYFEGGAANLTVAKVNGVEITTSQLSAAYERLRRQLQIQYNSGYQLPAQAESSLKEKALQTLINVQALKQASLSLNYRVSSRQVDTLLANMPEFQVNGEFSVERFQKLLESTLYNAGEFLDLIKTSLLIDQPRLGLVFSAFALPYEINSTIALINQERDISYLLVSFKSFTQPIQISEDKIQTYYKQHQDEFKTPEQVSIEYVVLSLKDLMSKINPTEEALKKFYTDNSGSFTQPVEWKLESIIIPVPKNITQPQVEEIQKKGKEVLAKANKGESFTTIAREYSLETGDQKLKNWNSINSVPKELQKAVLSLTKAGQVSQAIQVNNGIVILKAIDIKQPVAQSYDQAKEKVKESFIRQQAEEKFADLRDKLSSFSYEHPDSLEYVSKTLGLPIKTSEPFSRDKNGKDTISENGKIREMAFSNDVLNLRNNSEIVQAGDDAIVLRVKTYSPANLLPIKTVEKLIMDKLKVIEIESITAKLANEIKQKLEAGISPDQVAKQYHLTWKQVGLIGRRSNKIDSAIAEAAFAMPRPKDKPSYAATKLPDGFAIIALKSVQNSKLANKEQRVIFAEQIQNEQGQLEYELYKQSQIKQAKIVIEQ